MNIRKLTFIDALPPMAVGALTVVPFIFFHRFDMGFLIGMSVVFVGLIDSMYREARSDWRYSLAMWSFFALHVVVVVGAFQVWRSVPVKEVLSLFMFDFIAMSLLLPKVTGIRFDESE